VDELCCKLAHVGRLLAESDGPEVDDRKVVFHVDVGAAGNSLVEAISEEDDKSLEVILYLEQKHKPFSTAHVDGVMQTGRRHSC